MRTAKTEKVAARRGEAKRNGAVRSAPAESEVEALEEEKPAEKAKKKQKRADAESPATKAAPSTGKAAKKAGAKGAKEAKAAEKASGKGELRRVVRLLTTYSGGRRVYLSALFLLVAEAVSAIYQPYPIAYLIDFFRRDRPPIDLFNFSWLASPRVETLFVLTGGLVLLTMLNSLADSMAEIRLARGGRTLGYNTREALYQRLHRLSLAFHGHRRTGDMLTRVTSDVSAVEDFVIDSVSDLAGSVLVLVGTLAFLFYKSWQVAVVALLIVPLLSLISNFFSQRIKTASKRLRAREGDLASAAQEMLSSIRVIQTYGRSGYEERRFAAHSRSAMEAALEAATLKAKFSWVVAVLEAVAISAVAWIGLELIDRRTVTVGTLVLFVILIQNMFKPTRKIIREWTVIGKIFASVERIAEVLDREASVRDRPDAVVAPALQGHVSFRSVGFSYQLDAEDAGSEGAGAKRVALRDVSFDVAPGQVVALVGASGAGKSTIAQLIPRLYDPDEGAVLVDGTDIRDFTLESLRAQISVVLQETLLFSGTVAENIAYGREDATTEDVVEAAKKAQAHQFIVDLPEGYDTVLGERGANLSGGQRQRLAIARAFVRNTPILILDEPTTGLDSAAAERVVLGLESLMEGKSTIIISHDLHLVRAADLILVMREGQIVQSGRHRALLSVQGPYAEFCARQGLRPDAAEEEVPAEAPTAEAAAAATTTVDPAPVDPAPVPATAAPAPADGSAGDILGRRRFQRVPRTPSRPQAPAPPVAAPRVPTPRPAPPPADSPRRVPSLADELNPLLSPRLHEAFPGLASALDASVMAEALQHGLFDGGRPGAVVEACSPGKAMLIGNDGVSMRYALTVRDPGSGRRHQELVIGRLFGNAAEADGYRRGLQPLARALRGRADVARFGSLWAAPADVPGLVVHAFPLDGELPHLVAATDPAQILAIFSKALGRAGLTVHRCQVELGAYGRRHRCVLRYSIDVSAQTSGRKGKAVVFGKVYSGDTGATVARVVPAITAHLAEVGDGRLSVPSHLTYLPDLHLSLLNRVPGRPLVADAVKAACLGRRLEPGAPGVSEAIDDAARVAASMHGWPTVDSPVRTLGHDTADLRREIRAMRAVSPALATRLGDFLDEIESAAVRTTAQPLGFAHGDYSLAQLLHEGQAVSLIDFDSACQAEPALDLGHFLGYLRLSIAKHQTGMDADDMAQRLSWRFLDAYAAEHNRPSSDRDLEERVQVFKALSLMRITVHAWQKLKPARIAMALTLLEDEVEHLP